MNLGEIIRAMKAAGCNDTQIERACAELRTMRRRDANGNSPADRTARYRKRRLCTEKEWRALRDQVLSRDGEQCVYCGAASGRFHIDHVVPVAKGGSDALENLVVACQPCNASKRDKTLDEWRGCNG